MMTMELSRRLKEQAQSLGFELVGIAAATPADGFERLQDWLARGFAGTMDYMERHADARHHPAGVFPTVRSVLMVGMNYKPANVAGTHCGACCYDRPGRSLCQGHRLS